MRAVLRQPLTWILLMAAALRLAGLFWGLPAADGWDNDGFAPRNFLTALALTWTPGKYFTYPPLHAILLAVPSLPVAGWALAHAPSLHGPDVIAAITQTPYMTYFSVLARAMNLAMALGIVWCLGRMAALVGGSRAGLLASGACALGVGLTYYGQVSNLDVPYLFWSVLALHQAMRAAMEQAPRRFWWAALCASAAIATKDQAYAIFALAVPLWLAAWFAADAWPRRNTGRVLVTLAAAALLALLALLLVDGALTNQAGFAARLHFLTGPASQDYAQYAATPEGWWALLSDMARHYARGPGIAAMLLAGGGLAWVITTARGARLAAGLLPLLAMLSFTLCFNLTALRSDDRFLLPQAVLAAFYIGIAADRLLGLRARPLAIAVRLGLAVVALLALHRALGVTAGMLADPRYDAERWLAAHVAPGQTIEVYDRNWLLPRMPAGARVVRLGQSDPARRNPMAGITEVRRPFVMPRAPDVILVSANFARRFLTSPVPRDGRIPSRLAQADAANRDARLFFTALDEGRLPYRLVHVSKAATGPWPVLRIHDSLNEPIAIFQRARR